MDGLQPEGRAILRLGQAVGSEKDQVAVERKGKRDVDLAGGQEPLAPLVDPPLRTLRRVGQRTRPVVLDALRLAPGRDDLVALPGHSVEVGGSSFDCLAADAATPTFPATRRADRRKIERAFEFSLQQFQDNVGAERFGRMEKIWPTS